MNKICLLLLLISCKDISGERDNAASSKELATFLQRVKNSDFGRKTAPSWSYYEYTIEDDLKWYQLINNSWITTDVFTRRDLGDKFLFTQGYFDNKNIHPFEKSVHGEVSESKILKMLVGFIENAEIVNRCTDDIFVFQIGDDSIIIDLRYPLYLNPVYRYNSSNKHGHLAYDYNLPGYCPSLE
jgi:hypothetical protein